MSTPGSRSQLIPRLGGEAEYLEAKRIADQLHNVHQAVGGLTRADAVMLATLCAAFEGTLECDPAPKTEHDFAEQSATLQALADSIPRRTVGLVRGPATCADRSWPPA